MKNIKIKDVKKGGFEMKESLSSKDRKQLAKQRKDAAKQAQKYHKEQEKKSKKSSKSTKKETRSNSKIEQAVNSRKKKKFENISREEKFIRESEKKIRNLEPQDFEDGYYIDEYTERKKQKRRAQVIQEQESEVIRRNKIPLTQKQIKIKRIAISATILLVVLVVGIILSLTVLFKTEKIEVEGDAYYYEDQIIAFSNVQLQQNIFIATMGSTPKNISENLPYVEEANVSFSIPDTVKITVKNATPSYVVKNGNEYLVVSSKGRILDTQPENTDGLPELKCGELTTTEVGKYISFSDENVPDILQAVSESLIENNVEDITGFDVTDTSKITLNYDNRITINIGLSEDIDYKIKTAMAIINEKLDPNNTKTITGTLDVSTCNTNKVSRYLPYETTIPSETEPQTTVPYENSGVSQDTYSEDTYAQDTYTGDVYTEDTYTDDSSYYTDDSSSEYSYSDDTYSWDDSSYEGW